MNMREMIGREVGLEGRLESLQMKPDVNKFLPQNGGVVSLGILTYLPA